MWKNDGTAAGATPVKQLDVGHGGDSSLNLAVVDDTIFFATPTPSTVIICGRATAPMPGLSSSKEFPAHYGSLYQPIPAEAACPVQAGLKPSASEAAGNTPLRNP